MNPGRLILWAFLVFPVLLFAQKQSLKETGLYSDFDGKIVDESNLPFSPQYPLWTDGSAKSRWVFLPNGSKIITGEGEALDSDFDHWTFPVGTKFWKEFAFPDKDQPQSGKLKRVETRLMEKTPEGWEFSTYVWNDGETDATLAPEAGIRDHYPTAYGTEHDVPGQFDCLFCHDRGGDPVLGFDAIQLSGDRDPLAPHAAEFKPGQLTFRKLVEEARLTYVPEALKVHEPRIPAASVLGRASMGYLHGNCGMCHNPNGAASWTGLFMRTSALIELQSEQPIFMTAIDKLTQGFQIPGQMETFRLAPKKPEQSAVLFRMQATGFARMPPVGTEVPDDHAGYLLKSWIEETM